MTLQFVMFVEPKIVLKNDPYETHPFEIVGTGLPFSWHPDGDD